jgi:ATP-binding cassette subfamily B (MDR/TAP) protein 1
MTIMDWLLDVLSYATQIKGVTGDSLGVAVQQISTLTLGIIIAFIACWRLALVVLACMPTVLIGAAMQMKLMSGFATDGNK